MGFQAGTWLLRTLGPLGSRWLRRCVALHYKPIFLRWSGQQTTDRSPSGFSREPSELRPEAPPVAIARRKFLVGRHRQPERNTEPADQTDRFPRGIYGFVPNRQAPIHKSQL